MILILTEANDISATHVCEWVKYMGGQFLRINTNESVKLDTLSKRKSQDANFSFIFEGQRLRLHDFHTIWFRRGWFTIEYNNLSPLKQTLDLQGDLSFIEDHIKREIQEFSDFLYRFAPLKVRCIGNVTHYSVNKLTALETANHCGLSVPNYIITSSKQNLMEFFAQDNCRILSKAIKENITYTVNDKLIYHPNNYFESGEIESLPDYFQPTFFQEYIEKEFEIRTFFMCVLKQIRTKGDLI